MDLLLITLINKIVVKEFEKISRFSQDIKSQV